MGRWYQIYCDRHPQTQTLASNNLNSHALPHGILECKDLHLFTQSNIYLKLNLISLTLTHMKSQKKVSTLTIIQTHNHHNLKLSNTPTNPVQSGPKSIFLSPNLNLDGWLDILVWILFIHHIRRGKIKICNFYLSEKLELQVIVT